MSLPSKLNREVVVLRRRIAEISDLEKARKALEALETVEECLGKEKPT